MRRLLEETNQFKNQSLSKGLLKIVLLVFCFSVVLFNIPLTEQNRASSADNSYEEKMPETVFMSKDDVNTLNEQYPDGLLSTGTDQDKKIRIKFGYRNIPVRYMKNAKEEKTVEDGQMINWLLAGANYRDRVVLYAEEPLLGLGGDYLFQTSLDEQTYKGATVFANHWGASNIRRILTEEIMAGGDFFSVADRSLIFPSQIGTYDYKNNGIEYTLDFLYLPAKSGDYTMALGEADKNNIIVHNSYAAAFSMSREPDFRYADPRIFITGVPNTFKWNSSPVYGNENSPAVRFMSTQPALQLNLNNIAFFSQACSFDPLDGNLVDHADRFEEIAEDTANVIRLKDSSLDAHGPELAIAENGFDIDLGTAIHQSAYSSNINLVIVAIGTDGKAYRFLTPTDRPLTVDVRDIPGLPTDGTRFTIAKAWIEKYDSSNGSIKASEPITIVPAQRATVGDMGEVTCEVDSQVALDYKIYPTNTTEKITPNWQIDAPEIASVDSKGNVTAKNPGTATIRVLTRINERTYEARYTVKVIRAAKEISLNKDSTTIEVGEDETLIATVLPPDTTDSTEVTWSSSDDNIATVDATGKVTANNPGDVEITATLNANPNITAKCPVKVTLRASRIDLNKTSLSYVSGYYRLIATVYPKNTTDSTKVTWSSDNEAVATVDGSGMVHFVGPGNATITAELVANPDIKATCAVTVERPATGMNITPTGTEPISVEVNKTTKLGVEILPPETTDSKTVTWESSNTSIATVSTSGVVTGKGPGTVTITATLNARPSITATRTVEVTQPVTGVTLSPTMLKMVPGGNANLTGTVTPINANDQTVTWSVTDANGNPSDVVSLSQSSSTSGTQIKVTANKAGVAIVTASAGGHTVPSPCTVTVVNKEIAITPAAENNVTEIEIGGNTTLTAKVTPSDVTFEKGVTWSSGNTSIATVDSTGKVTANALGTTTITAKLTKDSTIKATRTVKVIRAATGITLNKTAEIAIGDNPLQLTATLSPANTTQTAIDWSSSKTSVATVDANGKVTAVAVGKATITAKVRENPNLTADCEVTVIKRVTGVTLSPTMLKMVPGGNANLTGTVTPINANDQTVTWSVTDANGNPSDVVSLSQSSSTSGTQIKVTANKAGVAIVTASAGGHTVPSPCTVTVVNKEIAITPAAENNVTEIEIGGNTTLTAKVTPSDVDFYKTVTWSSSNTSIASLYDTYNGIVKAENLGTTTITAELTFDSTIKATRTVKVIRAATEISLDKTAEIAIGDNPLQLKATLWPASTTQTAIDWSSSKTSVATVDADGKVTAVAVGKATITATVRENPNLTADCEVTVIKRVTGVTLSPTMLKMVPGGSANLTGTVTPNDASDKTVTWSVTDVNGNPSDVVSLSQSSSTSGTQIKVTATKAGTAIVTASAGGHDVPVPCTVTVVNKEITITPGGLITLEAGNEAQLTAKVTPSDVDFDKTVTWSSSNEAVATVDANGKVTAVGPGDTTITAKLTNDSTIKATRTVKVTKAATGMNITPKGTEPISVEVEKTTRLGVEILPPETTDSKTVTWKSSNTSIATVSTDGIVKGVSRGTVTITATLNARPSITATRTVEVTQPVDGVTVTSSKPKMVPGTSAELTATVTPSNASNQTVTWSFVNGSSSVLSLGQASGEDNKKITVTALKAGTEVVLATAGGKTGQCLITVVKPSIEFDENPISIVIYTPTQVKAKVLPADVEFDKRLSWTRGFTVPSGEEAIEVDENGWVTINDYLYNMDSGQRSEYWVNASLIMNPDITARCDIDLLVPATGVSLNKESTSIAVGSNETLIAKVTPDYTTDSQAILWSSSNEAVATVDSSGKVLAKSRGTATITATLKANTGLTATCDVEVTQPVTDLSISPTMLKMVPNTTTQIGATVLPSNANDKTIRWDARDPNGGTTDVVSVATTGHVKALKPGTAIVKATAGSITKTCTVTVEEKSISLKESLTLVEGDTNTLKATVLPEDASFVKTVRWESSDSNIATVNASGLVTAVKAGTATITAKLANYPSITATCTVTVETKKIPVQEIRLNNNSNLLYIKVGTSKQLKIDYTPENTTQREIQWDISDPDIITIDETGLVTAKKFGNTTITPKPVVDPGQNVICYPTSLNVVTEAAQPTGITLDKDSVTLEIGNSETLTATLLPDYANGGNYIAWESSDSSIAAVSSDGGQNLFTNTVTAKKGGTVTITAYPSMNPEAKATCTVTVPQPVESVSLDRTQLKMVPFGEETLTATVLPDNAYDKTVTWAAVKDETGEPTDVVTVDSQGKIRAQKAGSALVIATAGDHTAECTVWVENRSITVLPSSTTLQVGGTETLTAEVSPADANFDKTYTWSSQDSSIARVNSITGEVTAVRPGTVAITAKLTDGSEVSSSCTVTVKQPADRIVLSKTSTRIEAGESDTLTATVLPLETTDDQTILWSSDNEAVATVKDGIIKAVKAGNAKIKATLKANPDITAECTVEVTQRITGVQLDEEQLKMVKGGRAKLNAKILPEDATDRTIHWTVLGGSGVISIDQDGNITANRIGIAVVTVISEDGKQLARCTVFVEKQSIELSETSTSIEAGATKTLTTKVLPEEVEFVRTLTWSSDNEAVATVDAASGLITAKKAGEATITAALQSDPNITATCIVTVTQAVTEMNLNKASTKLIVGTSETLTATFLPEDATQDKTILWSSDNEAVATVDAASGLVTAKKEGEATITATLEANPDITAACQVTTVDLSQQITSVELGETILRMVPTESKQISATVYPTSLSPENKVLTFESNDRFVATVDQTGRVTAVNPGFTTVIIKAENHVRPLAYCTIFVEKTSISLDQTEMYLMVGGNDGQLRATTLPEGLAVNWVSEYENIATVDNSGLVRAVSAGTTTITATLQSDPTIKASCGIKVNPRMADLALDIVSPIPESGYFASGDVVKLKASYTKESGNPHDDSFKFNTVGSDGGTITGFINNQDEVLLTIGKTINGSDSGEVSAIVEVEGSNLRAERNINFAAYKATVDKKVIEVEKGKTIKVGATIKPEDESNRELSWAMGATTNGVFAPSDKNIATVDEEGNLTGVNLGEDTLVVRVVKDNGTPNEASYDQCVVRVVSPRIERVELNNQMLEMVKGENEHLTATIFPEGARERTLTFESSDVNVATVDQDGNIRATGAGFAVILVKEANGDGTPLAYCSIWVVEKSVTLDQAAVNMLVGSRRSLIATVSPKDAELVWESADNNIATVVNGVIQAKAVGSTIITASLASDRNVKAECPVNVTEISVAAQSIALSETSVSLSAEETKELSATVLPEGTTDDTALTWRSINESIAIVDQNGVITAKQPGRTIIEVKLNNNPGITAECEVIVAQAEVPAEIINLNKVSATINTNKNVVLEATVEPSDTTDDKALIWTSSNDSVATVKNGAVTGISEGKATITVALASRPSVTATCAITVEQPITKVTLNKTMDKMIVGNSDQLTPTIEPSNATHKNLIWESSDRSVATVENGNVTAVGVGVATIIVKATDGTMLAFHTVWVVEKSVILDQTDMDMLVGDSKTLKATASPENAELVWESGDHAIATIENGVVTAKEVGSTTITVSLRTNPEINATCLVVVKRRL